MFHRPPPHGAVQFCIMCKSRRVKCFTVSYDCNKYHHTSRWFISIFPFLFISKIKLQIDFFISVWTVERFSSAWRSLKAHIWNHLNRTCTAFQTQSFNNYSAVLSLCSNSSPFRHSMYHWIKCVLLTTYPLFMELDTSSITFFFSCSWRVILSMCCLWYT